MDDGDIDGVLGRIETALDRIEAALRARPDGEDGETVRLRESNARLRAALGGAIARIDGLLERVEGDADR